VAEQSTTTGAAVADKRTTTGAGVKEIDQADVDHWFKHGYVVVEGFLSASELDAVRENIAEYMPSWEEYEAKPFRYIDIRGKDNTFRTPPGWVLNGFPFVGDALNKAVLHPYLIGFVERIVGHKNLALSHAGLVGKYAGKADYDQELHPDYSNNTLAFPESGTTYIDVPMIAYYTDVTIDLGPTYVVSQEHTKEILLGTRHRSRKDWPELYEVEQPVTCPAGSVLIYSMRTFHRGSAMRARKGLRFSSGIAFHTAGPRWRGSATYQREGGSEAMDHFITNASPRERELVGFPAPGDPYWTAETREGVASRYPEMDMSPYGG
jgi:ectoine hydroxylase-related dioxygenase (phytanoyl-CoA dioxygenase family)